MTATTAHQDLTSLNPFDRIPEELFEFGIFQHFSFNDIVKLSQVSHQFDNLISESRSCLDKISLRIDEISMNSDFMEFRRDYHHLRVIQQISNRNQDKNLKMLQFLKKFAHSLKSVQVKAVLMSDRVPFKGEMKALEELDVTMLNHFLMKCFSSAPQLKSLKLGVSMLTQPELLAFVNNFVKLQSLSMRFTAFDRLFAENIAGKVTFALRKLEIQRQFNERTNVDENLEAFLASQTDSLKEITFTSLAHARTLNVIFNKLSIENLTINSIDNPHELSPKTNKSVNALVIKTEQNCSALLLAAVNLKSLHIHCISKMLLEFLPSNMKFLSKVTYSEVNQDIDDVNECYTKYCLDNNLEQLNDAIIFNQM